jgi:prophage regulatory protein
MQTNPNPPQRNILREPACEKKSGLSSTTRWRLERKGEFPARVRLSANAIGWYEDEIDEWIASRSRAREQTFPAAAHARAQKTSPATKRTHADDFEHSDA